MIKYRLQCKDGHEFEGWFSNSLAFDKQAKRGLIACPDCGATKVSKALMAPSVATRSRNREEAPPPVPAAATSPPMPVPKEFIDMMRRVRKQVESTAEYVGPRFAEEARKIHYEESEARGIYGEASLAEAKELHEEGIEVLPLPRLPEDAS